MVRLSSKGLFYHLGPLTSRYSISLLIETKLLNLVRKTPLSPVGVRRAQRSECLSGSARAGEEADWKNPVGINSVWRNRQL